MQEFLSETHIQIKLRLHTKHNYPPHFHKELEMIFMFEGANNLSYNGTSYRLEAGNVFIAAPNSIHSYNNPPHQCSSLLLIIDPHILVGPAARLASALPCTPIWSDPEKQSAVWPMIKYAFEHGQSLSKESFILLLSSIISIILESITLMGSTQSLRTEQKILDYCQNHYLEPITSEDVASALGISRSHVSHTFSNILNTSFPTYINGLRLNNAIHLLATTNLPIIDIASQAGFTSLRTFNRVFTDHFGFSPSKCRKQNMGKEMLSSNFIKFPLDPSQVDTYSLPVNPLTPLEDA